jgi:hypothetical protein
MLISLKKKAQIWVFFLSENIQPIRRASSFTSIFFIFFINIRYISILFCSTDGHTFSGAMIVVEFNGFKHFLGKGGERSYS